MNLGYTDALRALHRTPHLYTFWDYQGGGWQHDKGLRIDHFLLSPQAADLLESCEIDRGPRGEPKASDHTPVVCRLPDPAAARVAACRRLLPFIPLHDTTPRIFRARPWTPWLLIVGRAPAYPGQTAGGDEYCSHGRASWRSREWLYVS